MCVLPTDDVPVLPRLDKRLLPAFGALCAAEPELRRLYPAVAGAAVRAMLESKSMKGLFQLADEIDVDVEDCTSKDAVVQALLTSGKSLVPMVPAVSAPVRAAGTDRAALMTFHKATGGPSWESNRGWGTSARLCDWYGVGVDYEGRVVELKLSSNNLAGALNVRTQCVDIVPGSKERRAFLCCTQCPWSVSGCPSVPCSPSMEQFTAHAGSLVPRSFKYMNDVASLTLNLFRMLWSVRDNFHILFSIFSKP